uniref:CARD domain-containing protein n=1 Tax=Cyprinodon variegatus TaxID=28743 RepID=A0A3Q2CEE6_CYPVA
MEADTVKNIRSSFVDKASKELIKQLLDDLLEDDIINDGEKDSILEENITRADMARALIDAVWRKGNEASRLMITDFRQRDPTLSAELNL